MKIHTIWVSEAHWWEDALLYFAIDQYAMEEDADVWHDKLAEAHIEHGVDGVRIAVLQVDEAPLARLWDDPPAIPAKVEGEQC